MLRAALQESPQLRAEPGIGRDLALAGRAELDVPLGDATTTLTAIADTGSGSIISTIFGIRYVEGEVFPAMAPVAWLVWVVAGLAIIYATLAVWAKRWHDRDKSGWWSLIAFVPESVRRSM